MKKRNRPITYPDPADDLAAWMDAVQTEDFPAFVELLVRIRKAIGFTPERILDFGYGWGISAAMWLTSFPEATVYCCDPLGQYKYGKTDPVSKLCPRCQERFTFVHCEAEMVLPCLKRTFDFIFVDADHEYPSTLVQIGLAWDRLEPGGVMSGHDWDMPDVRRAVTEFAKVNELVIREVSGDHGAWLVRKAGDVEKKQQELKG